VGVFWGVLFFIFAHHVYDSSTKKTPQIIPFSYQKHRKSSLSDKKTPRKHHFPIKNPHFLLKNTKKKTFFPSKTPISYQNPIKTGIKRAISCGGATMAFWSLSAGRMRRFCGFLVVKLL
jgi:hypothetical protein